MNAYKKFAYCYDEVVSSVEYDLWLEFIEPYLKKNDTILDLACGTGTLLSMLTMDGYTVEGLDLSEEIIEIAREKAKINHFKIPFHVADMIDFNLNKKFNMITCFFDSINFIEKTEDVNKMLSCVKKHLKPKGYFIFDIFSYDLFIEFLSHEYKADHLTFKIDWTAEKVNDRTLKHNITIQEDDIILNENYYEYYHEIKSLNLEGFKLIKMSGDFNDDFLDGDKRILLVLQAI